jgi:hypothetical protein
MNM